MEQFLSREGVKWGIVIGVAILMVAGAVIDISAIAKMWQWMSF